MKVNLRMARAPTKWHSTTTGRVGGGQVAKLQACSFHTHQLKENFFSLISKTLKNYCCVN